LRRDRGRYLRRHDGAVRTVTIDALIVFYLSALSFDDPLRSKPWKVPDAWTATQFGES